MDARSKRRAFGAFCFLAAAFSVVAIFHGCENFGVEADFLKGTVRGELTIDTVVPAQTDEIRVALSPDFPPSDFKELQISEVISVSKDTSVKSQVVPFEMQVPLGKYDATVVIWKAKDRSWSLTDIVGLHGDLSKFELRTIELTSDDPVEDNVSIPVDLSIVNRTSTVSGTIHFVGKWPANTFITALIMLRDISDLNGIPPVLVFVPIDSEEFSYSVGISPDTYTTIAVAWLPIGPFDFSKIRFLGVYEDPENPGEQGKLVVTDSMAVTGIDLTADFANAN